MKVIQIKAHFLKFDSKYNCEIVQKNIKNGRVMFDDGIYIVDQAKPFFLKSTFGRIKPLYIIKWDKPYPAVGIKENEEKPKDDKIKKKEGLTNEEIADKIQEIELQRGEARKISETTLKESFPEYKYYTPEMLKALADMEVMKNLLGPKKKGANAIIMLIIGMIIGAVILYLMKIFGLYQF